jgi:hypothetical protein
MTACKASLRQGVTLCRRFADYWGRDRRRTDPLTDSGAGVCARRNKRGLRVRVHRGRVKLTPGGLTTRDQTISPALPSQLLGWTRRDMSLREALIRGLYCSTDEPTALKINSIPELCIATGR